MLRTLGGSNSEPTSNYVERFLLYSCGMCVTAPWGRSAHLRARTPWTLCTGAGRATSTSHPTTPCWSPRGATSRSAHNNTHTRETYVHTKHMHTYVRPAHTYLHAHAPDTFKSGSKLHQINRSIKSLWWHRAGLASPVAVFIKGHLS